MPRPKPSRDAQRNETGQRINVSHPFALYSDGEVEQMRRLREDNMKLLDIAQRFGCSVSYASKVCRYLIRASTPAPMKLPEESASAYRTHLDRS